MDPVKEKRKNNTTRTFDALEAAGRHGLPSTWFDEQDPPIRRGAARIWDLKKAGYKIHSEPDGPGCRYFLDDDEQLEFPVDQEAFHV